MYVLYELKDTTDATVMGFRDRFCFQFFSRPKPLLRFQFCSLKKLPPLPKKMIKSFEIHIESLENPQKNVVFSVRISTFFYFLGGKNADLFFLISPKNKISVLVRFGFFHFGSVFRLKLNRLHR